MCGELGGQAGQPAAALGMVGLSRQEGSGQLHPSAQAPCSLPVRPVTAGHEQANLVLPHFLKYSLQKPSWRCHCSCPGVISRRECCLWAPGHSVSISLPHGTPAPWPTQLSSQKFGNDVAFKQSKIPSLPAEGKRVSRGFAACTDVNSFLPHH